MEDPPCDSVMDNLPNSSLQSVGDTQQTPGGGTPQTPVVSQSPGPVLIGSNFPQLALTALPPSGPARTYASAPDTSLSTIEAPVTSAIPTPSIHGDSTGFGRNPPTPSLHVLHPTPHTPPSFEPSDPPDPSLSGLLTSTIWHP